MWETHPRPWVARSRDPEARQCGQLGHPPKEPEDGPGPGCGEQETVPRANNKTRDP